MKIDDFVKNFSELFEETDNSNFTPLTRFRDIEEWSSLLALSVIAMVDDKYHIKITGDNLREAQTIEDIFKIVQKKQAELLEGFRK
jgi:acyl carrier protein